MTTIDTGRATAAQLALILDTRRAESGDDAAATDAEILAHVRNTLTLPGEGAPGGHPVTDDGTDYAAALIAFLTPAPTADALLATIEQLQQQVWAAAPVLLVVTVTDDGETYRALRCPVCDQLVTDSYGDLYAVDVSTRWNIAETDDDHQQMSVSRGTTTTAAPCTTCTRQASRTPSSRPRTGPRAGADPAGRGRPTGRPRGATSSCSPVSRLRRGASSARAAVTEHRRSEPLRGRIPRFLHLSAVSTYFAPSATCRLSRTRSQAPLFRRERRHSAASTQLVFTRRRGREKRSGRRQKPRSSASTTGPVAFMVAHRLRRNHREHHHRNRDHRAHRPDHPCHRGERAHQRPRDQGFHRVDPRERRHHPNPRPPRRHGNVIVRAGQRRTLAAGEAEVPTVPVYVVEGDDTTADRIIQQIIENDQRADLSTADRTAAWAQLAFEGISAAQIAKRTGTKTDAVKKGLAVAESATVTSALNEHALTLDQAAVLLEFEDDADARAHLIEVATTDPAQFEHTAQSLRDDAAEKARLAAVEQEQIDNGFQVLTHGEAYGRKARG